LKQAQLFEIHKGVQENDVSVKLCMCTVLLLTMVLVLYLLEVFILSHYGQPSTETPTTETTTVRCHKNIYLTRTYYWWLLRPTITIWFDSELKKTLFTQHLCWSTYMQQFTTRGGSLWSQPFRWFTCLSSLLFQA